MGQVLFAHEFSPLGVLINWVPALNWNPQTPSKALVAALPPISFLEKVTPPQEASALQAARASFKLEKSLQL